MRLEPTPRPEQTVRVSARLIASSTILHLSSDELEHAVSQEAEENPALGVVEQHVCLFCGSPLHGQACSVCGHLAQQTQITQPLGPPNDVLPQYEQFSETQWTQQAPDDMDNYGFAQIDSVDEYDPMTGIPTGETLAESLLMQLETLIAPDDAPIAEQLVGNLDEHGYLEIKVQEIAEHLQVPLERVEYVLSQLQTLEPVGIGARDGRECLLIQLQALSEQNPPPPLVYTLIESYLEPLGRNQFHEIAKKLKHNEQEIRKAAHYIRTMLHPFPAQIYRPDIRSGRLGSDASYIRPDIIIRRTESGFEVELIEEKRYAFQIRTEYFYPAFQQTTLSSNKEVQRYVNQDLDKAKFFVESVQRRWRTLRRVAEFIVAYQQEFLEKGVRSLRPLTRAEVAAQLNLDEGTVSRTTANKYALLPKGQLLPLSDFFDSSLSIKDVMRELIQGENPKHRLSDEELARQLSARGIPIARRTVTKYREEIGIGSSRER